MLSLFLFSSLGHATPATTLPGPVTLPTAGPESVWVQPLVVDGPALWFTEESRLLEAAVADELRRRGLDVLPVATANQTIDRMAAGKFPDREGGCDAPPSAMPAAFDWLDYALSGHGKVVSRLNCEAEPPHWLTAKARSTFEPGCTLTVNVYAAGERHSAAQRLSVRLPIDVTVSEAVKAVSALDVASPAAGGGILGALGKGWMEDRAVRAAGLEHTGRWSESDLSSLDSELSQLHGALNACEQEPAVWLDLARNPLQIAVDGRGKITRCEPLYRHHLAPYAACRCEALQSGLDFSAGARDRRLQFQLTVQPIQPRVRQPAETSVRVIEFTRRTADDPTALLGADFLAADALRGCLVANVPTQRWPLTLTVGANGVVSAAQAGTPIEGGDPDLQACLGAVAKGIQLVCPFSGTAQVAADVVLASVPLGPVNSPDELAWAKSLGIQWPYVSWNKAPALPNAPLFVVLADGSVQAFNPDVSAAEPVAELRVFADERAPATALVEMIHARQSPALKRVFVYGSGADVAFRLLVVPAPAGAVPVAVGPPPPGGNPMQIPVLAPGVTVVISAEPGATVGGFVEVGSRLWAHEVVLTGR